MSRDNVKILNISSYDYGGAGQASVTFNNYLLKAGYFSRLIVRDSDKKSSGVIKYNKKYFPYIPYKIRRKKYSISARRWRHLRRDNKFVDTVVFDDQNTMASASSLLHQAGFIPDVIFIHWVHNFVTPELLAELHQITRAKIVSLMMDDASITGGCHYPFSCIGFTNGCKQCPMFGISTDFPSTILSRKDSFYPQDMEFWATTSDCLRVEKSLLGRNRKAYPILFPINEDVLPSLSKEKLRNKYKLTPDRKVIMIGCTAFNLADNRKGFDYLISVLLLLGERFPEIKKDITLIIVGNNDAGILGNMGYKIKTLGYLPIEELMEVYKASDLFLSTSIEDSGPLMVNQAVSVGTPVASFDVGVVKDLVIDNKTGLVAPLFDFESLAIKIGEYFKAGYTERFSLDCISIFKEKSETLSPLVQLRRILNK